MSLNTDHLKRCIDTLQKTYALLQQHSPDSIEYELFRNALIKGYELTLETAGKLLKKALKPYFANPQDVDQLVFKDIFRYASKHHLLEKEEIKRWFGYRDNRNNTAHDYGVGFAEETLILIPFFLQDVERLLKVLKHAKS